MRLLAKSLPRDADGSGVPDEALLPGHLRETHNAASALLECAGADQVRALGLAAAVWVESDTREG